jgi:ubiquinone/menaquinone biosynthesis C-methylase UbiE
MRGMSQVSVGQFIVGMEGLALLRAWLTDHDAAGARVAELARMVADPDGPPLSVRLDVPAEDVRPGYARWASSYDATRNPLIHVEEPAVHALLDALPVGTALDAACGTGRHARALHARGHHVIGVDASPEMLDVARRALPDADLRLGDLTALPVETASVDLVVCALALTHCEDVVRPVSELARVLRRGGHLVVSDFHPFQLMVGGNAFFFDGAGRAGYVRSYAHTHETYFAAFAAAGLRVTRCLEPRLDEAALEMAAGRLMPVAPEAFRGALLGTPEALVWQAVRDPAPPA